MVDLELATDLVAAFFGVRDRARAREIAKWRLAKLRRELRTNQAAPSGDMLARPRGDTWIGHS